MMRVTTLLLVLSVLALSTHARADSYKVSGDDVLDMMALLPGVELGSQPYRWDQVGNAKAVAQAISDTAPDLQIAAEMTVYAIYEGSNKPCAVGDHGAALGNWQLQGVKREIACDPSQAAPRWLAIADASRKHCANLDVDDRLAELASGSCLHGRVIARRRSRIARALALKAQKQMELTQE
jgi:hypothetical protein